MSTVKELLSSKGNVVWSVSPDQTVYEALTLMAEKDIGALMVVERDKLCGIVSERDYARSIILADRSSKETRVGDIMSEKVMFVTPTESIDNCMALMTEKRFRHLPVLDDGKLVGVISMPDLVKAVVEEQQYVISQLENYISQ